jgi:hypothetical protein
MDEDNSGNHADGYDSVPPNPRDFIPPKYRKKSKVKRIISILIILIILGVLGAFGYKWYSHRNTSAKKTSTATEQPQAKPAAKTKHYDSVNFSLGFDYPEDWTVTDQDGSGVLTIKSPTTELTDANGQKTTGNIALIIRNKQQKLSEFDAGNATAALDSEKIAYKQPTQTQRGSTYISFLQYAKTTASGALDGIYVTGDNGYKALQAVPKVDIAKGDPLINVTFISGGKPLSIASSSWKDNNFSDPIKNLLESLVVQ